MPRPAPVTTATRPASMSAMRGCYTGRAPLVEVCAPRVASRPRCCSASTIARPRSTTASWRSPGPGGSSISTTSSSTPSCSTRSRASSAWRARRTPCSSAPRSARRRWAARSSATSPTATGGARSSSGRSSPTAPGRCCAGSPPGSRRAAPPVGELLAPGFRRLVAVAFGLAVLNMSSYWFTYTWLPTYLTEERGLSIAASGWKILVVVLGELLGYASFGWVSDRFGRKPAFSLYATLMAAGLVSITLLWRAIVGWPPLLLLCLGLVGFGTGTWSNFGPMFAELFPTRLRTTAVGSVFNAARGAQFVAPLVVAAMARHYGLGGGIALAAGFALAAAGWVWLLPETRGRRMEA